LAGNLRGETSRTATSLRSASKIAAGGTPPPRSGGSLIRLITSIVSVGTQDVLYPATRTGQSWSKALWSS